jgi:hypothetical protein
MGRLAGILAVTAILTAVAPGIFGGSGHASGPLRWEARPRTTALAGTAGARLLFGRVVNRSHEVARLQARDVHVVDAHGDDLHTSAAYADGYVPAVSLRAYGGEVSAADDNAGAVGQQIVLKPGQAAPLSVSFTVPAGSGAHAAVAIAYGKGRLALE